MPMKLEVITEVMMKIAIISDTHINGKSIIKLTQFLNSLEYHDLIIHCGDIGCYEAYETIKRSNKCAAVYGNIDDDQLKAELKEKEILKIEGCNIGLFHGHGKKGTTLTRVMAKFKEDNVDIIIFGHSHKPRIFTEDNILYLNPGSVFYKRKEKWYSYIILDIGEKKLEASLHFYKSC